MRDPRREDTWRLPECPECTPLELSSDGRDHPHGPTARLTAGRREVLSFGTSRDPVVRVVVLVVGR